jgi:hypothetical protein
MTRAIHFINKLIYNKQSQRFRYCYCSRPGFSRRYIVVQQVQGKGSEPSDVIAIRVFAVSVNFLHSSIKGIQHESAFASHRMCKKFVISTEPQRVLLDNQLFMVHVRHVTAITGMKMDSLHLPLSH